MASLPQCAQCRSTEVESDDDELTGEADFDDCFGRCAFESNACDDTLCGARFGIALALGDLPRKDDVFEIKD